MKIIGVILAAGLSKRMGENKLLLEYNGDKLIKITVDKILKSNLYEVVLVVAEEKIYNEFKNYDKKLKVLINNENYLGISTSIKTAIKYIENINFNAVLFCVSDQPLLKLSTINNMLELSNENIVALKYEDNIYNPVIFSKKYMEELKNIKGDVGGKTVLKKYLNTNEVVFYNIEDKKEVWDIDNKDDYKTLINLD